MFRYSSSFFRFTSDLNAKAMTLQDLKNNREQIIATLTELVGADKVAQVMKVMVGGIDSCDSIEECIEGAILICEFETYAKKDSKLVQLHNAAHIDEKYNVVSKEWEKI